MVQIRLEEGSIESMTSVEVVRCLKEMESKCYKLTTNVKKIEQSVIQQQEKLCELQQNSLQQEKCLVQLIDIIASTNNKVTQIMNPPQNRHFNTYSPTDLVCHDQPLD